MELRSLGNREQPHEGDRWTVVLVTTHVSEAEIVGGLLEAHQIPTLLRSDVLVHLRSVNVGPAAEIELLVPEERAAEALEILSAR